MRILLALLVAISVGGLLGALIYQDAGYVLINYGTTVVEMSLWVALTVLIATYLLVRGIIWLLRSVLRSQGQVIQWRSSRKLRNARQQTVRGLLFMAEGRWAEAKKALLGAADKVETPLINYLNAARAAHELGETAERDEYLARAHETTPAAKFASLLTQAEFQISDGRYEQALAALLNLRKRAPKHRTVLAMLARCYEALGDWQALHAQLSDLVNQHAVDDEEVRRLSRIVWQNLLVSEVDVAAHWKKMPRYLKEDPGLMLGWIDGLYESERLSDAEEAMRLLLEHQWQPEVVRRYGIYIHDPGRQLVTARTWAKSRPNDGLLALTLGRLCLANKQFEQAREFFETALRLEPDEEVYGELGRLCVALGDERRGTDYLLRSLHKLPDLPQPAVPAIRKTS